MTNVSSAPHEFAVMEALYASAGENNLVFTSHLHLHKHRQLSFPFHLSSAMVLRAWVTSSSFLRQVSPSAELQNSSCLVQ